MSAMIKYYSSFARGIRAFPCGMYHCQGVGLIASDELKLSVGFCAHVGSHFFGHCSTISVAAGSGLNHAFAAVLSLSHDWRTKTRVFLAHSRDPTYGCDIGYSAPSYHMLSERRKIRTEYLVRSVSFLVVCSTLPLRGHRKISR